jgi:hypothetical protein
MEEDPTGKVKGEDSKKHRTKQRQEEEGEK